MSDSHDHSHDTSDEDLNELINSLSQVIDKGTPEVVLENVEDDDVVSEALATLYEMDSLGVISSLPSITPDWSLAIRRFLETYSEGVEVEDDLVQIGGTSENSRFMYGFGIMIDGLERPDLSLSPDILEKIQVTGQVLGGGRASISIAAEKHLKAFPEFSQEYREKGRDPVFRDHQS